MVIATTIFFLSLTSHRISHFNCVQLQSFDDAVHWLLCTTFSLFKAKTNFWSSLEPCSKVFFLVPLMLDTHRELVMCLLDTGLTNSTSNKTIDSLPLGRLMQKPKNKM